MEDATDLTFFLPVRARAVCGARSQRALVRIGRLVLTGPGNMQFTSRGPNKARSCSDRRLSRRERPELNMAATMTSFSGARTANPLADRVVSVNSAPAGFDAAKDLPEGFLEFLAPLHAALTLRQRALVTRREIALAESHAGKL